MMPNEEFGGDSGSSNNNGNNNTGDNTVDPGDDKVASIANIQRKMMPDSLNGKSYSNASQNNIYIVIHNTAGGTAQSNVNYFHNGSEGKHTCTHYVIDDKEIFQLLENNWKATHCGDKKDDAHKASPIGNNNSIGIEVADGDSVDHLKAIEVVIELTRYLMKTTGIGVDNVVRHHDASGKNCPATIMKLGKWEYIKSEIKSRNDANKPIQLDTSLLSSSGSSGSGSGGSGSGGHGTGMDILPNVDHRYNIANMDEVKGACLIFLPPYNVCTIDQMEGHFQTWNNWDRQYHYLIDPTYDVDANPDDDIPDLTNAKSVDEMNDLGNNSNSDNTEDSDSDTDIEDNRPRTIPRTIQPRAPLGPDDMDSGTNTPQQPGDGGDGPQGVSLDQILLIGDSLTVGMESVLEKVYPNGHAKGKGGKWAKHWLQDLDSLPPAASVSCVVQWLGINGVHNNKSNIADSQELLTKLKAKYPGIPIYNMKIFPVGKNYTYNGYTGDWWRGLSQEFNAAMSSWCASNGVTQIDATEGFITSDGYLDESKTVDKLHFNTAGYEQILSNIARAIGSSTSGGIVPSQPIGPKAEEDNSIVIKGGFQIDRPRLLQCYGLEDNDKVTYISRSLYNSKPTAHCLMIACFIPTYDQLQELNTSYAKVEKNIINAVSKILWANGLTTDDLWREFDMNRSPSPANYLDRNSWTDLLLQINKQVVWRNKKFGKVVTKYEKYIAVIPDQTIPDSGVSSGSSSSSSSSGSPDIGNISDNAEAVWKFFTGSGFTKECTAGIMGNLQQESGMDPSRHQSGGGKGRGICQWTVGSDRFKNLEAHAKSRGKEWTDLQSQLEFLDMELQGKDATTLKYLKQYVGGYENFKKMTNVNEACKVFEDSFERAGMPMMEKRYAYAKQFYDKFAGGTSTASYIQPRSNQNASDGGGSTSGSSSNSGSGTSRLLWPVPGHDVGSGAGSKFGMRLHPIKKVMKMHNGIDIPAPGGTSIKAAADGEVTVNAYQAGGAGNYIKIKHAQGLETVYMHMQSKSPLSVGTKVTSGQEVGKVGTTGGSTGNHLHFEVHENGEKKDPLLFTNKDNSSSTVSGGLSDGSTSSTTSTGDWIYNGPIINTIWGDIANPGPAANLPYNGNSMGGLDHDDWGGIMSYYVEEPTDEEAEKPTIDVVFTDTEYRIFCEDYFIDDIFKEDGEIESVVNFNKFWQLIDLVAGENEPYDKGLVSVSDAAITPNDRLGALTTTFTTDNENVFHFNVIESGPGSNYHCVKAADELNYIITPTDLRVEPIYPDLIIPPQFTTSGYDSNSENSIPLSQLTEVEGKEFLTKQLSFDYDILKDMKKETNKCFGPVNFLDPYPTDDKIEELEQHYPKVFIDEIEAQLYSCNHPGCPIGQPMAKNFAMLSDAVMNQSQRVEKRLVRLENILSTIMRNQARLSSRININCVYYGGQSTYAGKYKCIRCMHDDRINDGAIVTLDQCLNCTRYEPVLGQVYQILDETGYNGSIVLDDMQMSYSDLETFKRLNIQSEQSPKYTYVNVNDDTLTKKPEKDLIELWKEANKEAYTKTLPDYVDVEAGLQQKDEMTNQDVATTDEPIKGRAIEGSPDGGGTVENGETDPGLVEDLAVEEAQESKYIFRMNWNETFLNSQQPDTKQYPTEGIIMRFKKQEGDYSYNEELNELDPEKDLDAIEDIQKQLKLINGIWTDTREKADTVQVNKYSSEKFYFDGFAEMKASTGPGSGSSSGSLGSAECRKKICEMAETIVKECDDGKAWYSQTNRTVDYNKPGYYNGKKAYDCTGFVSCCYTHAGLKSMYAKTAGGGTLMDEIVNNHGDMWLCNDEGISKAKPGDVLVTSGNTVSQSDMDARKKVSINHAMIYMGDSTIAHAANSKKGIVKEKIEDWRKAKSFFVRPKDLIDADAAAASSGGSARQVNETEGEVDGQKYVARILGAVCTSYTGSGAGSSGMGCEYNKTCASHNLPYGTKVYIPQLADKTGGNGVYTVTDTGGPFFDFDIYTTTNISKGAFDAYVLEWGSGKISQSFTKSIDQQIQLGQWNKYKSAWNNYKTLGGKLVTFTKYSQEDANIKNHPNYNDK